MHRTYLLFFLLIFSYKAFAIDLACKPRLIIGSGKLVTKQYQGTVRDITECDITIDRTPPEDDDFIDPTHNIDTSNLNIMHELATQYENKFYEIIVEHVGEGPIELSKNSDDFIVLLKYFKKMLKKDGVLVYESYRHGSSHQYKYGNDINVGAIKVVEEHFDAIEKSMQNLDKKTFVEKIDYIIKYYETEFSNNGFTVKSILVKDDKKLQDLNKYEFPVYYAEIIARNI
jgi:hypothetical protein